MTTDLAVPDADTETRARIAAGFRHLADLIETPGLPLPASTYVQDRTLEAGEPITRSFANGVNVWCERDPRAIAAIVRAALRAGYRVTKVYGGDDSDHMAIALSGHGVTVSVLTSRSTVCTRRQVGTEPVEHAAEPAKEAWVEERPVYEWDCSPVLSAALPAPRDGEVVPW